MRSLRARILSEMTSFSLRDQEEEAEDIWWNKQGRLRRQVVQVWNRSLRLRTIQHESMMYYGPAHQTTRYSRTYIVINDKMSLVLHVSLDMHRRANSTTYHNTASLLAAVSMSMLVNHTVFTTVSD